jgi:dTDP-4-amino-4,6-dideoxygalactose transaminase
LKAELRDTFGIDHVFLVSSGKAALTLILSGLRRVSSKRKVVMPAYTCYSVPSAVVKAGLDVALCDVNPATLDLDREQLARTLDDHTLCVLPMHLFGLPADVERVQGLCRPRGITVVEDAAQAMGGMRRGRWLGTIGDVGFFSLGRGKNLSSGGGGVIVTRSATIAAAIQEVYDRLPEESRWIAAGNLAELVATEAFIRPQCYWLPAGLPFLGLGETRFYRDFPIERMAEARAGTLAGWRQRLAAANEARREQAEALIQDLTFLAPEVQVVTAPEASYLRLPVLVRDHTVKQALCARAAALGLGISGAYPGTIQQIPELQDRLTVREYPGAMEVVKRLVTLPTHRFVRPADRARICQVLRDVTVPGRKIDGGPAASHSSPVVRAASRAESTLASSSRSHR